MPLVEQELRWEIEETHPYSKGIDENMSIDHCKHSLFGASKVAADVLVQEYGRYFGMKTAVFRGGCLTGPDHSGTQLHGFLSYLMKCTMTGNHYKVFGYMGKQVRDNIHSYDLEAIQLCEEITGKKLKWSYEESNRIGDHIWWITDVKKFKAHYPEWNLTYGILDILKEIFYKNVSRWI